MGITKAHLGAASLAALSFCISAVAQEDASGGVVVRGPKRLAIPIQSVERAPEVGGASRTPPLAVSAVQREFDALKAENLRLRRDIQRLELERYRALQGTVPAEEANLLKDAVWDNPRIRVTWENPTDADATERTLVQRAIERTWELECGLDFYDWGPAQPDSDGIRIRIADAHPHCKRLGNKLDGLEDGMVLNFTFGTWCSACGGLNRQSSIEKIAIHEFGHAIGFAHEQNRDDAPLWCQEERQGTDGDWYITIYDPESIMNYCNPEWNNGGNLSDLDIEAVRIVYGDPEQPAPAPQR